MSTWVLVCDLQLGVDGLSSINTHLARTEQTCIVGECTRQQRERDAACRRDGLTSISRTARVERPVCA
eukprot:3485839-Prymnesium_polylepis.1